MSSDCSRQSGAAVVKSQANKVIKKAAQTGIPLEDTFTENAFMALNHARFGISIGSWKW